MTKMEHIYTLERMKTWSKDLSDDEIEAIAYALNTLNQEPCEDAVSRQAVLKAIKEWWRTVFNADGNPSLCDDILVLPSVTPQQKKGHWIYKEFDERTGMTNVHICSKCGYPLASPYKSFCSACGSDNREVEE